MSILLSVTGFEPMRWMRALKQHLPGEEIVLRPARADDPAIDYAVVWKQPPGVLSQLPNLQAIFSLGAGVDHILTDRTVPDVPIVRIVASDLTNRMSEYVVWRVLDHFRKGATYRAQQAAGIWNERVQLSAADVTVGLLGLGELGRDAAAKLAMMGFRLAGWSRSPRQIDGMTTFHGEDGLYDCLAVSDIIVVLLPLTPDTRGRARRVAARFRHPAGAERRTADGSLARCLRARAAAQGQRPLAPSAGLHHAARGGLFGTRGAGAADRGADRSAPAGRSAVEPRRQGRRLLRPHPAPVRRWREYAGSS